MTLREEPRQEELPFQIEATDSAPAFTEAEADQ